MNMPEEFYRTGRTIVDHRTYGGEITAFDFDGHHTLEAMATKIIRSYAFDRQCEGNIKNKNRNIKKGN